MTTLRPHHWLPGMLLLCGALLMLGITNACSQNAQWSPRGPGGGGAMFSPSINPSNNDEVYIACDMSGLYHSTDFGSTYTMMNFQRLQGGHDARVQFTGDPNILYCINYANDMALPVRSTDGGTTWANLSGNPDPGEATYSISADFDNPNRVIISYYGSIHISTNGGSTFSTAYTAHNSGSGITLGGTFFDGSAIYIGTNEGILVSSNGGVSFAAVPVSGLGPGERIFSFVGGKQGSLLRFYCLTADSNSIYVGIPGSDYWGFMKGVYSLDYGAGVWIPRMNGVSPGTDFPMYVAAAGNDTATVYLGGSSSTGVPTIMKSSTGGRQWAHVFLSSNNANIATGWSGSGGDRGWGYGECVFGLAVAPKNSQRVLFTDFGFVHRTTNGGSTWQQAYLSPADQNAPGLPIVPGKNYRSVGLEVTTCWQIFWWDAENLFACFSDIKGVRSTDGGLSWSFNYTGHSANSMYRLVQSTSTGTGYAATSNVHDMYQSTRLQDNLLDANDTGGKIIASTDNGAHWTDVHAFGHPVFWLAIDPNDHNTMYASVIHSTAGGVFVTHNLQDGASSSWTKLPNPQRSEGHPASLVVLNDGKVVCTYSGRRDVSGFTPSSGVFVYTPVMNSWADLSDPGMVYWTKDIVLDPNDALQNTWYVGVFSGWGGPPNGLGGLYRTTDRGGAWTKISNLDRVTSCTISPANPTEMYLTTETGGLWHTGTLNSVAPVFTPVSGYPFRQPERVFFNPFNSSEVWVSSFGAGIMAGSALPTGVVKYDPTTARDFVLEQNYPNPFNPATTIRYGLPHRSHVWVTVYNTLGQQVAQLVNGEQERGYHVILFDAGRLSSGLYFYKLEARPGDEGGLAGAFIETKIFVLVK